VHYEINSDVKLTIY